MRWLLRRCSSCALFYTFRAKEVRTDNAGTTSVLCSLQLQCSFGYEEKRRVLLIFRESWRVKTYTTFPPHSSNDTDRSYWISKIQAKVQSYSERPHNQIVLKLSVQEILHGEY